MLQVSCDLTELLCFEHLQKNKNNKNDDFNSLLIYYGMSLVLNLWKCNNILCIYTYLVNIFHPNIHTNMSHKVGILKLISSWSRYISIYALLFSEHFLYIYFRNKI